MKILICFGTRPEAIKMAPLYHELKKSNHQVNVCVTAQHREMLDQVLDFFEITPDYDLNLMQKGQSLNQLSSRILFAIDEVLENENPDLVLVHGDTTTSSMVALASFHKGIKIGHVEAGLRTYNKLSPFPEEINRQITGKLADYHFAPTQWAANNLINEKIAEKNIIVTGNTVIDALFFGIEKLKMGYNSSTINNIKEITNTQKKIILVTSHRRENFGTGFENLCLALKHIAENNDVIIIYPVHLNPNVQEPVKRILSELDNVLLINPLDYPSFLFLMKKSYLILTDSGGVQEEAPSLGKPILVMRDSTERPEALKSGTLKLVGTDVNLIINETEKLLKDFNYYKLFTIQSNPYGDGKASAKIVEFINNIS